MKSVLRVINILVLGKKQNNTTEWACILCWSSVCEFIALKGCYFVHNQSR